MDVERRNFEMSIPVTRAFSLYVFPVQVPHTNLFPELDSISRYLYSLDIIRLRHISRRVS